MLTLVALTMALGSLRIQIHDYANVPCRMLARASESVTATYEKVGVQTEWIGLVRHGKRAVAVRRGDGASQDQIAPLTIIILTPAMAARGGIPNDVLGLAAVAADGTGRIAYVIYDRVRNVAWQAAIRDDDLLGYVMSHEIGHLLLLAMALVAVRSEDRLYVARKVGAARRRGTSHPGHHDGDDNQPLQPHAHDLDKDRGRTDRTGPITPLQSALPRRIL